MILAPVSCSRNVQNTPPNLGCLLIGHTQSLIGGEYLIPNDSHLYNEVFIVTCYALSFTDRLYNSHGPVGHVGQLLATVLRGLIRF